MHSYTSSIVYFLTLNSLASFSIALPLNSESITDDISIGLSVRANCGPTMGSCGNCYGTNFPDLGYGICKKGYYQGCKCAMTCTGTSDYCNTHNCQGMNDPTGGPGTCTAGYYEGCPCLSVCNGEVGACNANGCEGINEPGGSQGVCTAGDYQGCPCDSICWDHDGDCASNGCKGAAGVCQAGAYRGCPCGTQCGNLVSQDCDRYGCAGLNIPEFGLGVCLAGTYVGCGCTIVCPFINPYCDDPGCQGIGGQCSIGVFNGCYCDQALVASTPTTTTSSPVSPPTVVATQSCTSHNHGVFNSYSVLIGVPFLGPSQCDATFTALEQALITNWQCVEENGEVRLWFNAPIGKSSYINSQLETVYPQVNNFNCPDT